MFWVKLSLLFYTREPRHYETSLRSKTIDHTIFVEQSNHFWREGPWFSEAAENVNYDTPAEMNTMYSSWTNLISHIVRLLQEKPVYKVK